MMLLLTSCVTTKTVYYIPEMDWPEPPVLDTSYDEETDRVFFSLSDYENYFDFITDYKALRTYYKRVQDLYKEMGLNED